ncbi:hypothetical protein [Psychroflexus montanilacus]|uniref:hypothetical protein n=1 Tax=Psychroflexus montanilacus TaxID=2873598 RepID=UPI001CCC7CC1|nr:hypothetical protein [Psychroflexus montanilacus]MBZ9652204.1 hypothetical protein [Psychroflexus montanilacus]
MIKDNIGNCVEPPEDEEVECPPGYNKNEEGRCVQDPCEDIEELLENANYTAILNDLNTSGNTYYTKEKGFGLTLNDNPVELQSSNNGHSVSFTGIDLNNIIGFIHTHPCGETEIGIGNTSIIQKSIPMPSPKDIYVFRRLLTYADDNGRNMKDIYMTVISCHGIFDIKYSGTGEDIRNWNMSIDLYKSYFEKNDDPVLAFKKYLDKIVNKNGNGFELYEYKKNETTGKYESSRQDFNDDETDVESINNCN